MQRNDEQKFHETVGILVRAFLEGTLEAMDCAACAVGNIVRYHGGYSDVFERWRWLRAERIEKDFRICQHCMSGKNLNVHHRYYEEGKMAWDYPIESLITLCENCHQAEHKKVGPHPKDELLRKLIGLKHVASPLFRMLKRNG